MRGIERRTVGRGRRAGDSPGVLGRPHERAVLLSILLILSMALFLVARDQTRPQREINALNHDALLLEAHLYARAVDQVRLDLGRTVEMAGERLSASSDRPLDALEAAIGTFGLSAEMALFGSDGSVIASKGTSPLAKEGLSLEGSRLNLGKRLADDTILAASVTLPPASPSDTAVRIDVRYGNQLPAQVFANPDGIHLLDPEGNPRLTVAVPIGNSGVSVVADRKGMTLFERWRDDAGLLVLPLVIGVIILGLLTFKTLRHTRASRQWAENERRFRVAVEAAHCGVWDWDLAKSRIDLSDYMADLLNVPKGSVLTNEQVIERVHPRYRDVFVAAMKRAQEVGYFDLTFPVPLDDGNIRWIDARGRAREPQRGEKGYSQIMGIALDITEARLAKARAQAAETRLIDGIQSVSDAFVLFDRRGRLLLWNQAFQDAFNFPADVLVRGALKSDLNVYAAKAIRSEHKGDQRRPGTRMVELKDGRWLQMTERFTGDGGTVVIAADVTLIHNRENERRLAAEEMQRTVNELEASRASLASLAKQYEAAMTRAEAASQSKSEFLANMSHELRTPLNAINGFSEIMAGEMFGPMGDARYKGYAQDIHNSGKHLLSLINDILDMAKIEAGKLNLNYERTDLTSIGREVVRLMRGRAEEAGLALIIDAPEHIEAEVDMRGIKQVLLNLVSNAIKFTPKAGRVMLEMTPLIERPGFVRVAVTDTGIGIAAEDVKRLAQPFVQVENQHAKTTQGTGLGLALTKSLIEMHGSSMTIDSEPGHGTTVWFDLPVQSHSQNAALEQSSWAHRVA